ncbi:GNAT family N-acetyltransferase [Microterricola pindariensis]|uniref:N-acetyltransferase family protein n=1 Tax=Microterricola pindariensis TaxID=478010 RepID=A0ABX5B014_9MICO|nr:GNAT family N-acetyltransferase [Microterricola pindariensis]PPL20135.1 N-acetyltransferase family protein [Microterricola pindariensis]
MLEEEYQPRRTLPRRLRKPEPPEAPFDFTLREAVEADMPAVREIYNYYVANSTVTFDEDAMTLAEWRDKFAYLQKLGMPFVVAISPTEQILGYALVAPWKQKRAYRFTVENSIYLGPAATGKGLGRVLLADLIERSADAGLKEMVAVIADQGAEASLALHREFGFRETGRMGRVGYKFERWLGIVMMQLSLG